jgi:hypothetical protein
LDSWSLGRLQNVGLVGDACALVGSIEEVPKVNGIAFLVDIVATIIAVVVVGIKLVKRRLLWRVRIG